MRHAFVGLLFGLVAVAPMAQAHPAKPKAALAAARSSHHALCGKPTELPLAGDRTSITGSLPAGAVKCYAFTAAPGDHLTLTIDSPNGGAVFQLYQLKWYQLPAHNGGKTKWIEIVAKPDSDAGQTWSGAVPGKGRHVLMVKSVNGATDFRLAIGIDPLHQEI